MLSICKLISYLKLSLLFNINSGTFTTNIVYLLSRCNNFNNSNAMRLTITAINIIIIISHLQLTRI